MSNGFTKTVQIVWFFMGIGLGYGVFAAVQYLGVIA